MVNNTIIEAIGFTAQGLFSARLLIQWIKTEQAQKIQSPTVFWILSLVASFLLVIYGLLRQDIVIVGGQIVSYYIYIRNLQLKQSWRLIHPGLRHLFISLPFFVLAYLFYYNQVDVVLNNQDISRNLLMWGTMGQAVFTLRFVCQWYASEKLKESVLPLSFWFISLLGSIMIISYAIIRGYEAIIIGQAFGMIIYARNLFIGIKNGKKLFRPGE